MIHIKCNVFYDVINNFHLIINYSVNLREQQQQRQRKQLLSYKNRYHTFYLKQQMENVIGYPNS